MFSRMGKEMCKAKNNAKGGELKMKTIKTLSVAVIGASIFMSTISSVSAMVNEDGTPAVVPTSPDQLVIMSEPVDAVPISAPISENQGIKAPTDDEVIQSDRPIYYLGGTAPSAIEINGNILNAGDATTYKKNDRVMVPVRYVAEALGFNINWVSEDQSVDIVQDDFSTRIRIGEDSYFMRYHPYAKVAPFKLGVAPEIKGGRTFVPLEFVSEVLKAKVSINDKGLIQIFETDNKE